jgi:hypothetical protein
MYDDAGTESPQDAGGIDGRGEYRCRDTVDAVERGCHMIQRLAPLCLTMMVLTYLPRSEIPLK